MRLEAFELKLYLKILFRGTWVAQLVEHQTPDFGSGHDLTVSEMELTWGSVQTARILLGILSLPLSRSLPQHTHVGILSFSQINKA